MSTSAKYWLTAIGVVVIVLWLFGTFDRALAPVGLNIHDCGQNAYGSTYCGEQLEDYEDEVDELLYESPAETEEREYQEELDSGEASPYWMP